MNDQYALASDGAQDIVVPLLSALQAAIAVLLTIFAGVLAGQFGLLSDGSSKEISKLCVKMLLPALLIYNVGSQMHLGTAVRYVPVIIWAIVYNVVSIFFGLGVTKLFKFPEWTTCAIAFNNTTSLPLLLVQSLDATGLLRSIDTGDDVVQRAKSFFLMNAMIGNSLTFALGPKLIHGQNEDAPTEDEPKLLNETEDEAIDRHLHDEEQAAEDDNEETSLLPTIITRPLTRAHYATSSRVDKCYAHLPSWAQQTLSFLSQFLNPPLIGAAIGVFLGLVPPLHKLFFNSQQQGGYFNAWLTAAIKNVGDLFAVLQILVVGVKLSNSIVRMNKGEASGKVPWFATSVILFIRFMLWPVISIGIVYALVTKTGWMLDDPLLWFCLMLMPTGPPALKLTALADVNGAEEEEKLAIAKFLIISYTLSPVICFAVVGSLKASQAAMQN